MVKVDLRDLAGVHRGAVVGVPTVSEGEGHAALFRHHARLPRRPVVRAVVLFIHHLMLWSFINMIHKW